MLTSAVRYIIISDSFYIQWVQRKVEKGPLHKTSDRYCAFYAHLYLCEFNGRDEKEVLKMKIRSTLILAVIMIIAVAISRNMAMAECNEQFFTGSENWKVSHSPDGDLALFSTRDYETGMDGIRCFFGETFSRNGDFAEKGLENSVYNGETIFEIEIAIYKKNLKTLKVFMQNVDSGMLSYVIDYDPDGKNGECFRVEQEGSDTYRITNPYSEGSFTISTFRNNHDVDIVKFLTYFGIRDLSLPTNGCKE